MTGASCFLQRRLVRRLVEEFTSVCTGVAVVQVWAEAMPDYARSTDCARIPEEICLPSDTAPPKSDEMLAYGLETPR